MLSVSSYLSVGEEKTDALHTDLQQSTLAGLEILNRKLTLQLQTCTHVNRATFTCWSSIAQAAVSVSMSIHLLTHSIFEAQKQQVHNKGGS